MGIEYLLRFAALDPAAVADVLRLHPQVRDAQPPRDGFDYGSAADGWPQATAGVEPDGVYFCDHCGGQGRAILGELVARLTSAFGPVTIEEMTNADRRQNPEVVTIDMTPAEAAILDAILRRHSESDSLTIENVAERQCLYNIQCLLEKHSDRPLWPSIDAATSELSSEES